jgi:hypothetical protein
VNNPHPSPLPAVGEAALRAPHIRSDYRARRLFSTALQPNFIRTSCHGSRLVCRVHCNACHFSGVLRGALERTQSYHFSHPAAAGSIDGNRKDWLQQTAAHSRNRIRKWRCLSLSRRAACDLSRPYVGRVKGTILRLQRQGPLPIHSDSTAAKATSSHEKSFGLTRIIREEALYLCLFACLAVASCEGGCSFVVKNNWRFKFGEARQRFRLTPTEKRVAVFVLAAVVLGLATKCYRDTHFSPTPATWKTEQASSIRTTKAKRISPKADYRVK